MGAVIFCYIAFPAFMLQAVGFFTPKWVSNSGCDSLGLLYQCCGGNDNSTCSVYSGGEGLDSRVLALQATSLGVMFLTLIMLFVVVCGKNDKYEETAVYCIIGLCCPIAGILSIVGCFMLVPDYSTPQLGYSFVLCVAAGCYAVLGAVLTWCCNCCSSEEKSHNMFCIFRYKSSSRPKAYGRF